MTFPQTAQFINNLLLQISHVTTQNIRPSGNDEFEAQTQTQRRGYYRLTQTKSRSAFPTSQAANLKPLMLTLHCIFPNDFLLALDILDRGLVRRVCSHACSQQNTSTGTEDGKDEGEHVAENQTQLKEDFFFAWNCTCPFFTISAFRDMITEPSSPSFSDQTVSADGDGNEKATHNRVGYENFSVDAGADTLDTNAYADAYSFGGTLRLHQESAPPVCKHILACLLAALCPSLGVNGKDEEGRSVTLDKEEIAALCAGWGG
ncbi:predicted protein [Aspergillus nidulans FGSC A4]|uniref:SWIM-type domain-containing protein n=1 Tax=Emericella nidulans (strain FGSC A4 / ATCC 38163 / CBS 112.46 / NRRL 194 / M139) TaxID=227321 RepID=Q5B2W0_EMENI|nr:hypothetical protein [Aspergillus nidulans FGSC A4]EAA62301.1 predicted protein [Aspergillus nidulans FGSC A4]CBF80898.1 TPA: conserved hypothetical protein [Aspergillus nidulans FGSC A4]|eukprot:XP_662724.1 predicted protein [Aspergillus nidulans FGSC A4]